VSPPNGGLDRIRAWMAEKGWTPFPFQEETWKAWRSGSDGLLHAPTGVGKTLAVWGGPLSTALEGDEPDMPHSIRHIWITPLRALARTTVDQLREPVEAMGLSWEVELRTGDTPSSRKARQRRRLPTVLVTTPESLSLLLSWEETASQLRGLQGVVVDEWHELMGTKRGVQTELALARLRGWNPELRSWGLSATLKNVDQAMEVLKGEGGLRPATIVRARTDAPAPEFTTLLPSSMGRFPWGGHLGLHLLDACLPHLDGEGSTLLFTNTRSQAELWYDAILKARPEWAGQVALHHGSLQRKLREEVEAGLQDGTLRCVVCTSSLDLGVDFPAVDRVIQVGSPKGVGRLLQRAGRSGHEPGRRSRLLGVPTHAFEIAEFAAARRALEEDQVEGRHPLERPLDVLAQHLVTVGLGGGFRAEELLHEVRTSWSYRDLTEREWEWVLDFVTRGGALSAYPRYHRIRPDEEGVYRGTDPKLARRHRMGIGTISSDSALRVRFLKGRSLGTVEESFVGRLRPGDSFLFAGRRLKLVRIRDMTAWVRLAPRGRGQVPRWMGGRMPLSTELSGALLAALHRWGTGEVEEGEEGEREALRHLLDIQARWSHLPGPDELLVERTRSREGHHLFIYPFLGRLAHEGLAALLAWRLSQEAPRSIEFSVNDYGMELLSPEELEVGDWGRLLAPDGVEGELLECMNAVELARRQFREVARIAGLIFPGYPGRGKSARQLQASSGLVFDVLLRYDPENLLLDQARREVLERELNVRRIRVGLAEISQRPIRMQRTERLTPLSFPLWADRLHARVSSEPWVDRVRRMADRLERAAGPVQSEASPEEGGGMETSTGATAGESEK
jgi:ATP-dependent helicase Lhr and Lhr-like helicase